MRKSIPYFLFCALLLAAGTAAGTAYRPADIVKEIKSAISLLPLLIPGVIILFVQSHFTTGRRNLQTPILSYMATSAVYYAIVLLIVIAGNQSKNPSDFDPSDFGFLKLTFLLFVGPVLVGLFLGINTQRNLIRGLLQKTGVRIIHPIPPAWDRKFSSIEQTQGVLVTLKDGTRIAGFFGKSSYASSELTERDIYLERVYYIIDEKGNRSFPEKAGILIAGGEIKTIEFHSYEAREE